ncbi:MAG: Gfo/Idh/MocA family oxidoreductase, partial [Phycisphaerae bacterium]|nr:Gfo/Idh/MocA family oxidoreductase [Phycisphaerae bacterium]
MMDNPLDRRSFLKKGTLAGFGSAMAALTVSGCGHQLKPAMKNALTGHKSMIGVGSSPKDVIKVGFVGIGNMGSGHVRNLVDIKGAEVVAVCDIRPEKAQWARKHIMEKGGAEPAVYTKGDRDFVRMCEEQDLDLVYNAAPWRWHTPICLAAMKNGKHAASEVNIALSLEDCWALVEASEKYRKHCIMQ